MKYVVTATVRVTLEDILINLKEPAKEKLELEDALVQKLNKQLKLLNTTGANTDNGGSIANIDCEEIEDWSEA